MEMQRFTERAQEALVKAQRNAETRTNQQVEPEQLLHVLLTTPDSVPCEVLRKLDVRPEDVAAEVEHEIERFPKVLGGQLYISNRLRQALSKAEEEAGRLKDDYISTEHLLLAIADE